MTVRRRAHLVAALMMLALLALAAVVPGSVVAQEEEPNLPIPSDPPLVPDRAPKGGVVPGQIIVKYEKGTTPSEEAALRRQEDLDKEAELGLIDAEVVEVEGRSAGEALRDLNRRPDVEYAEFDNIYHPLGYADEPRFGELWGLHNTGQSIKGISGIADVDVNAREASAITQGDPNLVVAVIDTGVDFSHPDLADRAWVNPDEVPGNGQDDDNNGYVDDRNGWDFHYNDKTVHDPAEDTHGTHVSGTIAASVNGNGVVGVAPNVRIMSLKFLGPRGGSTSNAIEALAYAKSEGAKISNNSWGGGANNQALKDAIDASEQLFVASAGNNANNNDSAPVYPASYDSPNILSVAAINNQGNLAGFSNYGATTVDISAPGVEILSSVPGIRDIPAATLSSVGSSGGKAVTTGFGADEIGDGARRASFFTKAFAAVDRGNQQVVLVDDDLSDTGSLPDVGATLSTAIQSATGSAPEVVEVGQLESADLSQISGKTVVWATGMARFSQSCIPFCFETPPPNLTTADRANLQAFLENGGKLVLTGMDALYQIENSPFVTGTLKVSVQGDLGSSVNATTFSGSSGTAFAGESYTFNSTTARASSHDKLAPTTSSSTLIQGIYPVNIAPSWQYISGTSMAAPHATGVAALVASKHPCLLPHSTGLKQIVMDSGKPVPSTAGKTVTGDMVDAKEALPGAYACVTNVSPAENAKGVAVTTDVTATFLGEMNPATLNASTFTLKELGSTTPVETTVSYDAATRTATLDPSAVLGVNHNIYTATIEGGPDGVKNTAGNALPADKVWIFSTVDTARPSAPVITSPPNNAVITEGNFTIFGTAEARSTVELFEGSASMGTTRVSDSGQWSKSLTNVADGSHTYTATARDAAGHTSDPSNPLAVDVRVAPQVTNKSPADQARSVAPSTDVTATFSEAMDEASVEKLGTFTLTEQGSSPVAATVTYDPTTNEAVLDPTSDLSSGKTYTATILGGANGAKDLAGNALAQDHSWTFTTGTPPETTITSGPSGTVNSTEASFTFSSSEANSTFKCRVSGGVWGSGSWSTCQVPWNIGPLSDATYTFEVYAIDPEGTPDPTPATQSWTVAAPPTVLSVLPVNAATGVALNTNVEVWFSEALDKATLTADTFTLTKQGSTIPVAAHVTYVENKATLDPDSDLEANTTYTATVKGGSTGVKDLAGNALAQDYPWTFTTASPPAPDCTITGTGNSETISGTSGADVICAGGGNDTIKGLGGNDTLKGEAGNDTLLGGVGNDTLDGGLNTDTASYSASLTAVIASLATNSSTGEGSDAFSGMENLLGSPKADTLTGSAPNNRLTGGGGNDAQSGGLGNDTVVGSGGADTLNGEGGADTVNSKDGVNGNDSLDGGAGTDTKVTDATERSIRGFP